FDGSAWIEQRKLVASESVALDNFGRAVDVEGDTALVGSTDGTYLYRRLVGTWEEIASIMPSDFAQDVGWSVSLSDPYAVAGAPLDDEFGESSGTAYVFRLLGAPDENANGVNDVCEGDCNENGVPDNVDIKAGTSADCNENDIPDECEPDCNGNGIADDCDIESGTSPDCTANGIPDECEPDCNGNAVPDSCDINDGNSPDCTGNGIPDECEPDCNGNGAADSCDIAGSTSADCNGNGVPDECEVTLPLSEQPQDQEADAGDFVIFSVATEVFLPAYQWRHDGVDLQDDGRILGSESESLFIFDIRPRDAGAYDCLVTDPADCFAISDTATLTVLSNRQKIN
ncbi:MAG: hypothetical protein IIB58_09180, partial [Planctomycetes bacterium]|nr:hypothetical protein [Planctomycetota bacterium]